MLRQKLLLSLLVFFLIGVADSAFTQSSILKDHEGMDLNFPPRVYFNGFNDLSLNIMVIAWYHPPNYWDYQAWLQRTCLEFMQQFEAEGIDFAFPSRTLYLADDKKRQLKLKAEKDSGSATI